MNKPVNARVIFAAAVTLLVVASLSLAMFSSPASNAIGKDVLMTDIGARPRASAPSTEAYNMTAGGYVNVTTITLSETVTDRLNKEVLVTVDATRLVDIHPNWDSIAAAAVIIKQPNGTETPHAVISATNIYEHTINFDTSMENGTYYIYAAFNETGGTLTYSTQTDAPSPDRSFINVLNWDPMPSVQLNATSLYRNETLQFNISIFDAETPFIDLEWEVELFRSNATGYLSSAVSGAKWSTGDALNQTWFFDMELPNVVGYYRFRASINDSDHSGVGHQVQLAFGDVIEVKNRLPYLEDIVYNYTDGLYRNVNSIHFEVNATDFEDNKSLSAVNVIMVGIDNPENITFSLTKNATTLNWTGEVKFSITAPLSAYNITIEMVDSDGGKGYHVPATDYSVIAKNNPPEAHGVLVNGQSLAEPPHFTTAATLLFEVDLSDEEGDVSFARITLSNAFTGKNYSFTTTSETAYMVNVSASMLGVGTWDVFVFVLDEDGFVNFMHPTNPNTAMGAFEIVEDTADISIMALFVVISLIGGIVLGAFVAWRYANGKIQELRRDMIIKDKSKTGGTEPKQAKAAEAGGDSTSPKKKDLGGGSAPPKGSSSLKGSGKKTKSRF